MTTDECFRTLDLKPGASEEQIRRAYLDQARVWHPDRFEADQRLRGIAEEHLRKINEAYEGLKGAHRYSPPEPAPDPTPPQEKMPAVTTALPWRSILRTSGLVALGLTPIMLAAKIVLLFQVPALDAARLASQARALRPRVLEPMTVIDSFSDPQVAVDTLNDWARGDVINLWSSSAKPIVLSAASAQTAVSTPRKNGAASAAPVPDPTMANGTELITEPQPSGAGELRVMNTTPLEAIVFLVRGERSAIRAMYVLPNAEASLQNIPPGIYGVHVEFGRGIDAKRLRFQRANHTPARFGPFEFWEARSTDKSWNRHYAIQLTEP